MRAIILLLTLDLLGVSCVVMNKNLKKKVAGFHGRWLCAVGVLGRERYRQRDRHRERLGKGLCAGGGEGQPKTERQRQKGKEKGKDVLKVGILYVWDRRVTNDIGK